MSCLHWTLSFTRTSLLLRSVRNKFLSSSNFSFAFALDFPFVVVFQRYDGDVGDLGLTLSYDEDVMGQVRDDVDELTVL